jgi:hypothetical protein
LLAAPGCREPASVIDHATGMTSCDGCHHDRWAATRDPAHAALGYPADCARCHETSAWTTVSSRPHADPEDWPLTGRHLGVACEACHVEDTWEGLERGCVTCHSADYAATTNPDHTVEGLPKTCETCHTPAGWSPALAAAHLANGAFPLTGGHAGRACTDCHDPDDYVAVPKTCHGCHADDYAASDDPSHGTLGLPTTCQTCHTTIAWEPADFESHHAMFPVTSGKHASLACSQCHPAQKPWKQFSCTACTEHSKARMDGKHLGEVSGHSWTSAACYQCHPKGVAEGD